MKAIAALVVASATLAVSAASAQTAIPAPAPAPAPVMPTPNVETTAHTAAALEAASRWLALMDAGKSGEAWDGAAPLMQGAVARAAWLEVGKSVRAPLGALTSRRLASSVFTHSLPGVPAGEYVVIRYAADFAGRAGVTETVALMRQADGSWKVATYQVR